MAEIVVEGGPTDSISKVSFNAEEEMFLSTSWDCSVKLFDIKSQKCIYTKSQKAALLDGCFYDYSLIVGGLERHLFQIDPVQDKQTVLGDHDHAIKSVEYCQDKNMIFSGSWDKTMRAWDPRSQTHWIGTWQLPAKVYSMSALTEGTKICIALSNKNVVVYDVRNLQQAEFTRQSMLKYQTRCIKSFQDGFVVSSIEGRVGIQYFSEVTNSEKTFTFKCHRKNENDNVYIYPVNAMAFYPFNDLQNEMFRLFTGGSDGRINFWNLEKKKKLWQSKKYPTGISSMEISKSGKWIVIACSYNFEEGEIDKQPDRIYLREFTQEYQQYGDIYEETKIQEENQETQQQQTLQSKENKNQDQSVSNDYLLNESAEISEHNKSQQDNAVQYLY